MPIPSRTSAALLAIAVGLASTVCPAMPPPYTVTSVARTGNSVIGTGSSISSISVTNGGRGFLNVSVNSAAQWLLDADTPHTSLSTSHEAIIATQNILGPFTPYILQGTEGFLSVPTGTSVATALYGMSLNGAGNAAFALAIGPDDFNPVTTSSGVFFNRSKTVFLEGDAVLTAGLAAGTTWNALDANTKVRLNDNNQLLVVSTVHEGSVDRRAVIVLQLDASGNVQSRALIAKEGGPVGSTSGTWSTIAGGMSTSAMNNSGTVVFSGTTGGGTDGIYSSASGGGFVAVAGGPTPVSGTAWGSLVGSSLDINNPGVVAFRGTTANGTGTYTESSPDAGEVVDSEDQTYGNGPLNFIVGTLSNDQDVDVFRIHITDGAGFSATTVPDPGSGFVGASFDTVLTLMAEPGNGGLPLVQCDNVSPTVLQSTIAGASGAVAGGRDYYLAISTPKSRCGSQFWHYATNSHPIWDDWQSDPAAVGVSAGLVYWPDPSAGTIRRATTAGAIQGDLAATAVAAPFAVDAAGGKIYWADQADSPEIHRSNLDGSSVEDIVTVQGFGSLTADSCTGLAIDSVNGKLYWSRSIYGEVNRCNLDGSNAERVIQDYNPQCGSCEDFSFPFDTPTGTLAPGSLAIDTSPGTVGKVFWMNTFTDRIERCNLDGNGRQTLPIGSGAGAIAIDSAAGKIYWTSTALGKIQRANLDGTSVQDVAITPTPFGIALDVPNSMVYWTDTLGRDIRRASIAGAFPATPSDVVAIGPDVGAHVPDGPGAPYSFGGWNRIGAPGTTALPYQIKLTGATYQYAQTMIVKGNTKVAAVGDPITGVAQSQLSVAIDDGGTLKLSDRGDVMWAGHYHAPTQYINYLFDGLFLNQDPLITSMAAPANGTNLDGNVVFLWDGPGVLDFSPDGRNAIVQTNMQNPATPFNQKDNALLFQFTYTNATGACCTGTACSISTQAACSGSYKGDASTCGVAGNPTTCCPANFNGVNGLTVQDIFDFLSAWFAGDPRADFNGVGGLSVQDIFDFLSAWFAGCA